ncbi:MAG: malto-oligosyltrehalose trehalohydrolase, partial [Longimicrobiales bacterium]
MTADEPPFPLGAHLDGRRAHFRVWAPGARAVDLVIASPHRRTVRMEEHNEYYTAVVDDVDEGQRYGFELDGGATLPDPASRHQPDGVHGLSAIMASLFPWSDADWRGRALDDYVIYELHVGTFTAAGTFDAAAERIPALCELGVTVVELMPVAQFVGARNWGYDGVLPYAAQDSYGGPHGLKRFVDRCHAAGLAVCLDVVYNHLGPEGNYLGRFGPYFTDRYHTPWGGALNFDGPHSDHVREYFIGNALQWIDEFHIDALRLDAIHAIVDESARPFLQELAEQVHERAAVLGRTVVLIAESDLGDARVIRPPEQHGLGMDAQWLDDFHHSLHTLLTGEQAGYYRDFGHIDQLACAYRDGFVYTGQYSAYRQRRHGAPAPDAAPRQFVVYAQNHDQIGNRMLGDRLARSLTCEQLKMSAAAV